MNSLEFIKGKYPTWLSDELTHVSAIGWCTVRWYDKHGIVRFVFNHIDDNPLSDFCNTKWTREDFEAFDISGRVSTVNRDIERFSGNKYVKPISDKSGNIAQVDVYDVLKAFNVTCPATQHAVKKLLCSGARGHKDIVTDLKEARDSIVRAIELNGDSK